MSMTILDSDLVGLCARSTYAWERMSIMLHVRDHHTDRDMVLVALGDPKRVRYTVAELDHTMEGFSDWWLVERLRDLREGRGTWRLTSPRPASWPALVEVAS